MLISEQNLRKQDVCGSGQEPVAASYEHGNELSGFIKGGELLD
jgi:hypothetical protein